MADQAGNGTRVEGDVDVKGGDFVGRDKIKVQVDIAPKSEPLGPLKIIIIPLVVAGIAACATIMAALITIFPDLLDSLISTPVPTSTVTSTSTPTDANTETTEPGIVPSVLPTTSLTIKELWPVWTGCNPGGVWSAKLWVLPEGGNDTYMYYIDGEWKVGPLTEGATIFLHSDGCTAITGTVTVKSGEQYESRDFFIDVPDCCSQ